MRTLAMMTATTMKTKSEGRRRNDNRQGQEEAGCVACGHHPRPARLAVAMGTMAHEDVGNVNNNEDKDWDKDGNGNEDEVATKTTMRRQRGQQH